MYNSNYPQFYTPMNNGNDTHSAASLPEDTPWRAPRAQTLQMSGASIDFALAHVERRTAVPAVPKVPSLPPVPRPLRARPSVVIHLNDDEITQPINIRKFGTYLAQTPSSSVASQRAADRLLESWERMDRRLDALDAGTDKQSEVAPRRVAGWVTKMVALVATANAAIYGVSHTDSLKESLSSSDVEVAEGSIVPLAPSDGARSEDLAHGSAALASHASQNVLQPADGSTLELQVVTDHVRENLIIHKILEGANLTPEQARIAAISASRFLSNDFLRGKAVGATVVIDSDAGNFTGTLLGPRSILTAKHTAIIDGKPSTLTKIQSGARMHLKPVWSQKMTELAYVVVTDPASDLAVIQFSHDLFDAHDAVKVSSDSLKKGQPLILCASPGGVKREPKSGYIDGMQVEPKKGELLVIKTNAPMQKGNSGGLVLNEKGELVGIHSMGLPSGTGSLSQTVTPDTVNALLEQARAKFGTVSDGQPIAVRSRQ